MLDLLLLERVPLERLREPLEERLAPDVLLRDVELPEERLVVELPEDRFAVEPDDFFAAEPLRPAPLRALVLRPVVRLDAPLFDAPLRDDVPDRVVPVLRADVVFRDDVPDRVVPVLRADDVFRDDVPDFAVPVLRADDVPDFLAAGLRADVAFRDDVPDFAVPVLRADVAFVPVDFERDVPPVERFDVDVLREALDAPPVLPVVLLRANAIRLLPFLVPGPRGGGRVDPRPAAHRDDALGRHS